MVGGGGARPEGGGPAGRPLEFVTLIHSQEKMSAARDESERSASLTKFSPMTNNDPSPGMKYTQHLITVWSSKALTCKLVRVRWFWRPVGAQCKPPLALDFTVPHWGARYTCVLGLTSGVQGG